MSRFDYLKSLVRSAAEVANKGIRSVPAVKEMRERFAELKKRRAMITEAHLGRYLARAPEVRAVTVRATGGAVRVEAGYEDGDEVRVAIRPLEARWAPRGAKEVVFEVEPAELSEKRRVRELVGCVAAAIARALWSPIMAMEEPDRIDALVSRDGHQLRIDLRTLPAVRRGLEKGAAAMMIEVLRIGAFEIEDGALYLKLDLPLAAVGG